MLKSSLSLAVAGILVTTHGVHIDSESNASPSSDVHHVGELALAQTDADTANEISRKKRGRGRKHSGKKHKKH